MSEIIQKQLVGANEKPIDVDYNIPKQPNGKVIVFVHGYKGFKDWGHWKLLFAAFVEQGFVVVSFNFSHNGVSGKNGVDFDELELFGENNYSKELFDTHTVLADVRNEYLHSEIHLVGHSRGGGIAILAAYESRSVKSVVTWAAVGTLNRGFVDLKDWKEKGVSFVVNGRTKQELPHYYQFFEDFVRNSVRLNVLGVASKLDKPMLVIHGTSDNAVSIDAAYKLVTANEGAELEVIEGADHVFQGYHPYGEESLSAESLELFKITSKFLL